MSVRIRRELLSDVQVNTIRTLLNIVPKERDKFVKTHHFVEETTKVPIQFYFTKDYNGTKYVHLPFQFGNKLMNTILNLNNTYPQRSFKFTGTLRDYQMVDMTEACDHLTKVCTTTLNFSTGAGKTMCSAFLSTAFPKQFVTMILVNNTVLLEQWRKTFLENTTAKVWVVGEETEPKEWDVVICMDTRVEKLTETQVLSIGVLIIDEIDRLTTPSRVTPLLSTVPKYIIGLTATLGMRADGLDTMIYALVGTHAVVRNLEKKITLYKLNTAYVPPVERTSRGTNWNLVTEWLYKCDDRNKLIVDFVLRHWDHKIMILCKLTDKLPHTKVLHDMIVEQGNLCKLGKIERKDYSQDPQDYTVDYLGGKKKTFKNCRILIGGVKKMGVGFDDASADDFDGVRINMLVMVNSIKDKSLLTQVLGRVRDPNPIIVYPVDDNTTIKTHFRASKKYVTDRNGVIIDVKHSEIPTLRILKKKEQSEGKEE
jgi:hypothetical protein